jgi:hypothetical protein
VHREKVLPACVADMDHPARPRAFIHHFQIKGNQFGDLPCRVERGEFQPAIVVFRAVAADEVEEVSFYRLPARMNPTATTESVLMPN